MSTFSLVASNTLYQAVGKVFSLIIGLTITALLARHLGQAGYGQFTLITTVIIMFGSITDWGTGFIAARFASQKQYPPSLIYGNVLLLKLWASLLGATIINFLGLFHWLNLPLPVVAISSLILFTFALRSTSQIVFQVCLKLQYSALIEFTTSLIFLLSVIWMITRHTPDLQLTVFSLLISSIIGSGLGLIISRQLTTYRLTIAPAFIKQLLKQAAPMGALLVVFTIYNRLDSFLLQHYQGNQAVGIYGLAYKIHDNLVMGAAFLMNSLYPLIARSSTDSYPRTQPLFTAAFHLLLLTGIVIALIFGTFAYPLILLLAGPSYLAAVSLTRILMFATIISYLNHLTGYTLAALGLQTTSLKIAIGALLINLTLNYLFIPLYSYTASAYITVITEGLVLTFTLLYLNRSLQLTPQLSTFTLTIKNLLLNRKKLF